ncbi:hypothetical protein GCM10022416_01310 [Actinomadura keratinilytica]|uniref:Uncharacterized protein n=1 Tax=Actinomadura keratinilytica TaxID=547461 RepID=A0ABP7XW72_9ACTN
MRGAIREVVAVAWGPGHGNCQAVHCCDSGVRLVRFAVPSRSLPGQRKEANIRSYQVGEAEGARAGSS